MAVDFLMQRNSMDSRAYKNLNKKNRSNSGPLAKAN